MKIAIFHELHEGGARKTVNEIAKQLKKLNTVDLYIVTSNQHNNEIKYYSHIYKYFYFKKEGKKNSIERLRNDTVELFRLNRLHKHIAEDISKKKYDRIIVHPSQFTQSPFVLRYIKQPKIYYCHEPLRIVSEPQLFRIDKLALGKKLYEHINRKIREWIDKENVKNANTIVTNSVFTSKNILQFYRRESQVIYHGIDTAFYFKKKKMKKAVDILFVGSKETVDGYYFFQDIKKSLSRSIRVAEVYSYEKRINDEELRERYQSAKIVLCLAYSEPFGLIPLEAMACGAVVLAVDEGGYRESIIQNKTGFLLPRNVKLFIKKTNEILENEEIQRYISKNAVEEIERVWSWDRRMAAWFALLKSFNRRDQHMV